MKYEWIRQRLNELADQTGAYSETQWVTGYTMALPIRLLLMAARIMVRETN